jgi:hypothetical protein
LTCRWKHSARVTIGTFVDVHFAVVPRITIGTSADIWSGSGSNSFNQSVLLLVSVECTSLQVRCGTRDATYTS